MGRKLLVFIVLAVLALVLTSCSQDSSSQGKPIAKVNDYVIRDKDFRRRIVATAKMYGTEGALTLDDKHNFLEREIEKELLIQEAVKLGLEKQEAFRDSIEKFWEQTLITALFKRKAKELEEQSIVTKEEVQEAYKKLCAQNADCPPLEKVRSRLERNVREQKKQKALDAWLSQLRKQAKIEIYEENLKALR
ncbi:MAG: SurA N-terminal domain-containing protein [Desulfarculaceae bacterium]|jgi:maltose-binding protein MalE